MTVIALISVPQMFLRHLERSMIFNESVDSLEATIEQANLHCNGPFDGVVHNHSLHQRTTTFKIKVSRRCHIPGGKLIRQS